MEDLETKLDQTMEELRKLKNQVEDEKKKPLSVEKDCDSCITSDLDENASKIEESSENLEISRLTTKLDEKIKELETVVKEKENLKLSVEEAMSSLSIAEKKTEELEIKLKQSNSLVEQLKLNLEAEEVAKETMEFEMKRLRIQTDQWRKASEAAASILATGDKKPVESYDFSANGGLWSPLITGTEVDEGVEGQKKRGNGGGIRVLGELWKKKGQHKGN